MTQQKRIALCYISGIFIELRCATICCTIFSDTLKKAPTRFIKSELLADSYSILITRI